MSHNNLLKLLFGVVIANFIVQIPYYFHQYHGLPGMIGVLLMAIVLSWFLVGFRLLWRGSSWGYSLTTAFLSVEFIFYAMTQLSQAASGRGILLHVLSPDDPVLFVVFGVGYINFAAAGFFVYYLIRYKQSLSRQI